MLLKKYLTIILIMLFTLMIMVGCGQRAEKKDDTSEKQQDVSVEFPTKPIELIVAYGAGGGTDITARLLADPLGEVLGQPVIVRNITGAGGWTGWKYVADATPDGYTIGYVNVPHIFTHYNDPDAGIDDTLDSWRFLVLHVADPCIWAVRPDSQFNTVNDVIEYAKQNPGALTVTAHGYGGDEWLAIKKIEKETGVAFDMIHNDSTAESIAQLLGGHVDILGANVGEVLRYVEDGEMRLLGVMWDSRSEFFPDTPTFQEQGVDVVMFAGRNIATPAGVPDEIAEILQQAVIDATNSPKSLEAMKELGLSADLRSGNELREFLINTERMVIELMGWD